MHLDLPEQPGDLGVRQTHEHNVVNPEERHQHQRRLQQLPVQQRSDGGSLFQKGQKWLLLTPYCHLVDYFTRVTFLPFRCLPLLHIVFVLVPSALLGVNVLLTQP